MSGAATRPQHGAAVILAMLVAALAATVAMAIAAGQQRWFADVAARRDQVQAQSLALAGVQWTRQILHDDGSRGALDFPGEPWALPLPPTPLENGTIEGRIVDAQGLLNANNLVLATTRAEQETARFTTLFARLRVPAAALDAIADWTDADARERPLGAEDAWYAREGGYLPANAALLRVGELAAVRGFDAATLPRVLPYVTALPEDTKLNVNTAPAVVLAAAVTGLTDTAASALAAERVTRPFTSVAWLPVMSACSPRPGGSRMVRGGTTAGESTSASPIPTRTMTTAGGSRVRRRPVTRRAYQRR